MFEEIIRKNIWSNTDFPLGFNNIWIKFENKTDKICAVDSYLSLCRIYFFTLFVLIFWWFEIVVVRLLRITWDSSVEISSIEWKVLVIGLLFLTKKSLIESLITNITSFKNSFKYFFHLWAGGKKLFGFRICQLVNFF